MKNTDFSLIKRPDVSSNNGAKLVLLYGWLNASQRAVQRFVDLYHESGYDVLYIPGRVIQFAWPPLSMKLARQVLATVSELGHYEHLLCHAISIGAYNHTSCMMLLQENPTMFQSFRNRLRGVIFDSLTLGSTKRMISGVRHGLSQNPLVQSLIPRLLSVYLCVTYKYTLNFFEKGVQLFQDFPLQVPTLFVYSRDDPMCDADLVDAIIKNWRENLKMTVSFICWNESDTMLGFVSTNGFFLLSMAVLCSARSALRGMFPDKYPPMLQNGVDPGKPLFLTPLVEKGQFDMAQKLSRVGPLDGTDVESYAGFFTVNKTTNSNMFFWFFPAQTNPETAPVVLWLQGGPGGSSLFGLFVENGPIMVDKDFKLSNRKVTWNTKYSMIYIDNPVGTGFSFTAKDEGYAKNEQDVARDLYSCLTQFFQVFHKYQKNDFYATGESYAGKYVPAISYKIHMENPSAKTKINLKGLAIGDGLCDPESMMGQYATFMYSIGLLDEKQRAFFQDMTDKATVFIRGKNFKAAFDIFDTLLNGDLTPNAPYFYNVTNIHNYYNFLLTEEPEAFGYYGNYLAKPEVRAAIHVGNLTYNSGTQVEIHLINDVMDTVKPWIATLMENYKVMFYNGQLDIIIPVPMTEFFLLSIDWSGKDLYRTTDRVIWRVNPSDKEVAGYVRVVKNFYQVIVRNAGHILPYDQPERGYDLIQRFIENRSFH